LEAGKSTMNSVIMLHGRYDYSLVCLSVMLAIFAAYAALDLAGRVTSSHGYARAFWLSAGASAMGVGIWTTHYVGMLALSMPMPVYYHIPTVLVSLLAAVAASGVALVVVSQPKLDVRHEIAGSVAMGGGIAAVHYVGMAALRCSAVIAYDLRIVALSIALVIAGSLVAIMLAFRAREDGGMSGQKIISALVMGCAIPVMHYTGMWSATFHGSAITPNLKDTIGISTIGVAAIPPAISWCREARLLARILIGSCPRTGGT
jgi:two-component system, sensor histidine kinase and response regulator